MEIEKVSEIKSPARIAKVHGSVASLSPMKLSFKGTNYFDGQLSDGENSIPLVGFDTKIHQELENLKQMNEPVAITNCEIKENDWRDAQLEVKLGRNSKVTKSSSKSLLKSLSESLLKSPSKSRTLKSLSESPSKPESSLRKSLSESPSSGSLLESPLRKCLSKSLPGSPLPKSYLKNPLKLLPESPLKSVSSDEDVESKQCVKEAVVVGVLSFDHYSACINCGARVRVQEEVLRKTGICSKCGMLQLLGRCRRQVLAELMVEGAGGETKRVCALEPVLKKICKGDVTKEALVSSEPFNFAYFEECVVCRIVDINREV